MIKTVKNNLEIIKININNGKDCTNIEDQTMRNIFRR